MLKQACRTFWGCVKICVYVEVSKGGISAGVRGSLAEVLDEVGGLQNVVKKEYSVEITDEKEAKKHGFVLQNGQITIPEDMNVQIDDTPFSPYHVVINKGTHKIGKDHKLLDPGVAKIVKI